VIELFVQGRIRKKEFPTLQLEIPDYFFLCLFFLNRFFRLWVAILCLFLFFPQGIIVMFLGL